MPRISAAAALANNEVAIVAWQLDAPITNCLGFEVTRLYEDGTERPLAAWVAFKGQSNPDWLPQTTGVWPVQRFYWRDLTVRKRRDKAALRPADVTVRYRIRAVVPAAPGLKPVPLDPKAPAYTGKPRPLAYASTPEVVTNPVTITAKHGLARAAFTNGILAAQWLTHALEDLGQKPTADVVRAHISDPGDKLRKYLTGDVLGLLRELVERTKKEPGSKALLALYELTDRELVDLIKTHARSIRLILSNSSKGRSNKLWDDGNAAVRRELHKVQGLEVHDRFFNNSRIGHNKFGVFLDKSGKPRAAVTGSTNWTPTGLCGQTNNAFLIESPEVAGLYEQYWQRLLTDTALFKAPARVGASTTNAQSAALRHAHAAAIVPATDVVLKDKTRISVWCSPNTKQKTKGTEPPPDLEELFRLMSGAQDAIFFAAFLPSRAGAASIIGEAVRLGKTKPSLLVYGSISDSTAMPNYVAPPKTPAGQPKPKAPPSPAIFDSGRTHICRASALGQKDLLGDFEAELLKAGQAIIHDKIVVVDPLSPRGFVAFGSHNLGYKASYENDENLVVIRDNPSLVRAYAVHILDVYDHYRFRAVQTELATKKPTKPAKSPFDGFLDTDDAWLDRAMKSDKADLARYLCGLPLPALTRRVRVDPAVVKVVVKKRKTAGTR